MMGVRLLLADDHEIVRKGLRAMLETEPGWEVVAEAADGRHAIQKTKQMKPDVAILDISMPSLNGLEAAHQIVTCAPQTKVLILTVHEADPLIQQVLEAGARGYLLKSDAARDLVAAVDALRRNKTFFTPKVAQIVLEGYLGKNPKQTEPEGGCLRLTGRQREIVQLLAEGKSSKEVAWGMGPKGKKAETHRSNIIRRPDPHSGTALVRYALRNHIIDSFSNPEP